MKKFLCTLLTVCLLATAFTVAAMAEETSTPGHLVAEGYVCGYLGEDVAFAGEYDAVKAEYDVWLFVDEQGEEMKLITEAGLNKEEIVFRYRGAERVGLPVNAEAIDWHFFTESFSKTELAKIGKSFDEIAELIPDFPKDFREYTSEEELQSMFGHYATPEIYVRNHMKAQASSKTAHLVSPYYILGGFYDLNNDGIYQERGVDYDGDLQPELVAFSAISPGDVNHDGACNVKDVLTMRKVLSGMKVPAFVPLGADFDGDGKLTTKDLLWLRKIVAGLATNQDLPSENRTDAIANELWEFG